MQEAKLFPRQLDPPNFPCSHFSDRNTPPELWASLDQVHQEKEEEEEKKDQYLVLCNCSSLGLRINQGKVMTTSETKSLWYICSHLRKENPPDCPTAANDFAENVISMHCEQPGLL